MEKQDDDEEKDGEDNNKSIVCLYILNYLKLCRLQNHHRIQNALQIHNVQNNYLLKVIRLANLRRGLTLLSQILKRCII